MEIKIYCHQTRHKNIHYLEQDFSAFQLRAMSVEEILEEVESREGVVYISYPDFLNVIGRHLTEGNLNASDIEVLYEVEGEYKQAYFDNLIHIDGQKSRVYQLKDWQYGYFYPI